MLCFDLIRATTIPLMPLWRMKTVTSPFMDELMTSFKLQGTACPQNKWKWLVDMFLLNAKHESSIMLQYNVTMASPLVAPSV